MPETNISPPTPREMAAYEALLRITREKGREPTALEAYPHVRGFAGLRASTHCYPEPRVTLAKLMADPGAAHPGLVVRVMRKILKRVGTYLGETERLKALKGEIAEKAALTYLEVLDERTRPADPRMVKALADASRDALRVAGHSEESRPTVEHHTHLQFGQPVPDAEATELDRLRRETYEMQEKLAGRSGLAAPRAAAAKTESAN